MSKVFMIRHDALGTIDQIFATPPTDDELEKIRVELARIHGAGHPKYNDETSKHFVGKDHPSYGLKWGVHVEEREVIDGYGDLATVLAKKEAAPMTFDATGGSESELPKIVPTAVGRIINPGDPEWVDRRKSKESDGESMTITADDVGTLKL